jgi:exodeoxyribonuclease III
MNIVTFNVAGLQSYSSKFPSFDAMLDSFKADIICFQKTKLTRDKLQLKMTNLSNYHAFYNFAESKITNGGVATFCKKGTATPLSAHIGFYGEEFKNLDLEGRCLITDHSDFMLINAYFPTNGSKERIVFKMYFCYVIQEQMEKLISEGKNVILATDLSFAHKEIDHYAPSAFIKSMGLKFFSEHRGRQWLSTLLETGRFVDAFRFLYPEEPSFSFWKNQELKDNNCGLRLDYFILNRRLANQSLANCKVMSITAFGHAPVKLILTHAQSYVPDDPPGETAENLQEEKPSLHKYFPDVPAPTCLKRPSTGKPLETVEGAVVCNHKEPAVVREVKKQGKNNGRPFYTCRRPPGHYKDPEARCDFFKWADEEGIKKCFHDKLAALKKVKNEGKNVGKWYFVCKKITNDKCDFFAWAEELNRALEPSVGVFK